MHFKTMVIFTEEFLNTKKTTQCFGRSFSWPRNNETDSYLDYDTLASECLFPFSSETTALSFYKTESQIIEDFEKNLSTLSETPLGKLYKKSVLSFVMHVLKTIQDKKLHNETLTMKYSLFAKEYEQKKYISKEEIKKKAIAEVSYSSKHFKRGELGFYTTLNDKAFFKNKKILHINENERRAEKNTLPTTTGFFVDEFKLTPDNVRDLYANFVVVDGEEVFCESFIPYNCAKKTYKNIYEFSELVLDKRGPNDFIVFYDCYA